VNQIPIGKGAEPVRLLAKYGNRHGLIAPPLVRTRNRRTGWGSGDLDASKRRIEETFP
jgi:hypothetical protein